MKGKPLGGFLATDPVAYLPVEKLGRAPCGHGFLRSSGDPAQSQSHFSTAC
jgi:hypothetical protein